jgi:transcriptional regulator with XRE-family HTH domain
MLGEKIKALREQKGISQRELGAHIEVDAAFMSKVEKGEKPMSRKHLAVVASVLDTDEDYLLKLWLADKVYRVIEDEADSVQILKLAEEKIKYNNKQ